MQSNRQQGRVARSNVAIKQAHNNSNSKRVLIIMFVCILIASAIFTSLVVVNSGKILDTPSIIKSTLNARSTNTEIEKYTLDSNGKLNWTSVKGAISYNVYVEQGDRLELVAESTKNSALIEGLKENQPAAFKVQALAKNSARNSNLSETAEIIVTLPVGTKRLNQPQAYMDTNNTHLLWKGVDFRAVNDDGLLSGEEKEGYYRVVTSTGKVVSREVVHQGRQDKLHTVDVSSLEDGTSLKVMALSDDDTLVSSQWSAYVTIDRTPVPTTPPSGGDGDGNGGDTILEPGTPTNDEYQLQQKGTIVEWNSISNATNYIVYANQGTDDIQLGWVGQASGRVSYNMTQAEWLKWSGNSADISVKAESWNGGTFTKSGTITYNFDGSSGNTGDGDVGNGGDTDTDDNGNSGNTDTGSGDNNNGGSVISPPTAPDQTTPNGWVKDGHPTRTLDIQNGKLKIGGTEFTLFADANQAVARLEKFLPRSTFNELFPNRVGQGGWYTNNSNVNGTIDYYSYENLKAAIRYLADITVILEMRADQQPDGLVAIPYTQQVVVINRSNPTQGVIVREGEDFNESWNLSKPVISKLVNMGDFLNWQDAGATEVDGYREIAGFLANLTQETSGGTMGQPDRLTHGLWWNEEIGYEGTTGAHYVLNGHYYPPMKNPNTGIDNSYHGRGPIQLSWNYNYGLFSGVFFGDAKVLLQHPEYIINGTGQTNGNLSGGTLAWMTGLAFWMMPQPPKPSPHETILGIWRADKLDINAGRSTFVDDNAANRPNIKINDEITFDGDKSRARPNDYRSIGFIMTVMVINGGLEGNRHLLQNGQVTQLHTRVLMYLNITKKMQALYPDVKEGGLGIRDIAFSEKLNTLGMFGY